MRFALVVLAVSLAISPVRAQQTSGSIVIESMMDGRKTITPDWPAINALPLGDKGNPVRVHTPNGQRAYLSRLICPDGAQPSFRRVGNFGVGVYGSIIDGYDVVCAGKSTIVVMDMYHPDYIERRPVPGFAIRSP